MRDKPTLLVLFGASGREQPASGPLQSLDALMRGVSDHFRCRFAAKASVRGVVGGPTNRWVNEGHRECFWIIGRHPKIILLLKRWLSDPETDLVMLNSFFDREFTLPTLLLRKFRFVRRAPVILSPRGEFAGGALSLKSRRKRAYLAVVNLLGLLDDVWLHATAEHERRDIEALGLRCKGVIEAPDTSLLAKEPETLSSPRQKTDEALKLAFLGRIVPVKNITFALDVLAQVTVPVAFDIFGPVKDHEYWATCEKKIAALPAHIRVTLKSVLLHKDVVPTLSGYDLFFLPTMGENFGHAINEALSAGLPVLIADTTPWRELEAAGAGWDLPLSAPGRFASAIHIFAAMSADARHAMRLAARRQAEESFANREALTITRTMLIRAAASEH